MPTATGRGEDDAYMDRALELAQQGRGRTSPNPMVGAIVVSEDGVIVGTGYHLRAGAAHAEAVALDAAGETAREGTLYCTLEPCAHQGRTAPCAERIVASGVRRVVVAVVDPNPQVNGRGVGYLRDHGICVDLGVRETAAARLNEEFLTWVTKGRPFVTMKIAVSRDGKIAARPGVSTALTSDRANEAIHQARGEVDALAVGSTTLLVDDPRLTPRGATRVRPLTRVVFDRRLRTPVTARLLETLSVGPVVLMTTQGAMKRKPDLAATLREKGAQLEALRDDDCEIGASLKRLGELQIVSVIIEGGAAIHRAAWDAGHVDRVQRFVAPVELGSEGVPWLMLSQANLRDRRVRHYGPDILTEAYVRRVD